MIHAKSLVRLLRLAEGNNQVGASAPRYKHSLISQAPAYPHALLAVLGADVMCCTSVSAASFSKTAIPTATDNDSAEATRARRSGKAACDNLHAAA